MKQTQQIINTKKKKKKKAKEFCGGEKILIDNKVSVDFLEINAKKKVQIPSN